MKISEIIDIVKKNCKGYGTIDESKTRDKVLYGDVDKECTGIVTTIYASYDVIKKANEQGANFIIAHEALFWNHGDHTDWLKDNETFKLKKQLLEEPGMKWFAEKHLPTLLKDIPINFIQAGDSYTMLLRK